MSRSGVRSPSAPPSPSHPVVATYRNDSLPAARRRSILGASSGWGEWLMSGSGMRASWMALAVGLASAGLTSAALGQAATKGLVDDKRLVAANDTTDADWITFGQDYRNQRFSALTQIDRSNVARLALAWVYQLGTV